jgi:hypothetical protein
MGNKSKQKGKRGENEAIEYLQAVVDGVYSRVDKAPPQLTANRSGWRHGRHDMVGFPWLSLEVKNVESSNAYNLGQWWDQCKEQAALVPGSIPVLMYKRAYVPFRVRMRGNVRNIDGTMFTTLVDISLDSFLIWFTKEVTKRLEKDLTISPGS